MSIFAEIAVHTEVLQQPQHILLFETRQNLYTERKTNLEFSLNALGFFPFSHNKFSTNLNVESFNLVFNVQWLKIKKWDNYHDTDTAFYVFKELSNSCRDLVKWVCKSAILTSALSVPMDLSKRLFLALLCLWGRWSRGEVTTKANQWVTGQARIKFRNFVWVFWCFRVRSFPA